MLDEDIDTSCTSTRYQLDFDLQQLHLILIYSKNIGGTVLGTGDIAVNKTDNVTILMKLLV